MKVLRANMFRNSLSVITENNEELELSLDEWQALAPHRPEPQQQGGQPKPTAKPRQGDGLLVVSVTPDTVEEPGLFDDLLLRTKAGPMRTGRLLSGRIRRILRKTGKRRAARPPDQPGHRERERAKAAASVGASLPQRPENE